MVTTTTTATFVPASLPARGHHWAFVNCPNLNPAATLGLGPSCAGATGINPWPQGKPGHALWQGILPLLKTGKATVAQVLAHCVAKGLGTGQPGGPNRHLVWAYTFTVAGKQCLTVNGNLYNPNAPQPVRVAATPGQSAAKAAKPKAAKPKAAKPKAAPAAPAAAPAAPAAPAPSAS